jgi:transcription-repair coupling factor (superfamily II helicase)
VESSADIERIRKEMKDRFGSLPLSVQNLLRYGIVKFLAQKIRIKSIDRIEQKIVFKFFPTSTVNLARMTALLERYDGSITPQGVMNILLSSSDETNILIETISVLKELSGM